MLIVWIYVCEGGGCGVGVGLGWGQGAIYGAKYLMLAPSFRSNKSGPNWLNQLQDRFRALKFPSGGVA